MFQPVYQFDAPDADVVLVSSPPENVEFHAHSCILAAASPFFTDMFTLPQPQSPSLTVESKLPMIPISEDRPTLDSLLRFIYPIPDPPLNTLDDLSRVLGAAIKYDFGAVVATLRQQLLSPRFVQTSPSRVFAIACRYDLETEAKLASRHTLSTNILESEPSDDLKYITAYSYHRLLDLHRRRAQAAQALLPKVPKDIRCMQCHGSNYPVFAPPKWWSEFEKRAREELGVRPTTEVIFGIGFLARIAAAAQCPRCPASILDSYRFLEQLKQHIDDLPATI